MLLLCNLASLPLSSCFGGKKWSNQVSQGEQLSWDHIFLEDLGYNISTRRMIRNFKIHNFFEISQWMNLSFHFSSLSSFILTFIHCTTSIFHPLSKISFTLQKKIEPIIHSFANFFFHPCCNFHSLCKLHNAWWIRSWLLFIIMSFSMCFKWFKNQKIVKMLVIVFPIFKNRF